MKRCLSNIGWYPPLIALVGLLFWGAIQPAPLLYAFDLQGHRGARGLAPENTLAGFSRALAIGVTTLEMDVGVTRNGIVVALHDQRLNPATTRDASGRWLPTEGPRVNSLTLGTLKSYDVGRLDPASRYAKQFPGQIPSDGARIPTLEEVFVLVGQQSNAQVRFNIETKRNPERADSSPPAKAFAQALLAAIRKHRMGGRVTIQSFDWSTLKEVQRLAPHLPTSYLTVGQRWLDNLRVNQPGSSPWLGGLDIDDFGGSAPRAIKAAGGASWSPYFREVMAKDLALAHELGLSVKVWTVNDPVWMAKMIDMGVDGIITDYPHRLRAVMAERGLPLPVPSQ